MDAEHVVIAVERHEEFRMDLFVYPSSLVAICMAGRMDVGDAVVDDVAPWRDRLSFNFCTARSLPGTTDEDKRTVSRCVILTYLCVLLAMRIMAAIFVALGTCGQDDRCVPADIVDLFARDHRVFFWL